MEKSVKAVTAQNWYKFFVVVFHVCLALTSPLNELEKWKQFFFAAQHISGSLENGDEAKQFKSTAA